MKSIFIAIACMLLTACITSQLTKTTTGDFDSAIAIADSIPDPMLSGCFKRLRATAAAMPASGGGIATVIAEKWAWDAAMGSTECIVVKAKINAFLSKFGVVATVNP